MIARTAVSVMTFLLFSVLAISQTHYTATNIGSPAGSTTGFMAFAMNNRGQIIGLSDMHGFIWTHGSFQALGDFWPAGINDLGQVVGTSAGHAALWDEGKIRDLGTFGGPSSDAFGINNHVQVIGWAEWGAVNPEEPFLWQKGNMRDILFTGLSFANCINDKSQIAGYQPFGSFYKAALWDKSKLWDIGTLGGDYSLPSAMNNSTEVVGSSSLADGHYHGFLWKNGKLFDLGAPPDYPDSTASAINERGLIVGSVNKDDDYRPAIYRNGAWIDLNDLIRPFANPALTGGAVAINNRGDIVVSAGSKYGGSQTWLLAAIHEK